MCSWRALLVPPLMQLVQSPNASGLYSARVPWQARTSPPMLSERLGSILDPGSLAGTNFPTNATACTVSKCLGPLLDPGSLAGTNRAADATTCVAMTRPTMFTFNNPVTRSCSKLPRRRLPERPWCVRRAETKPRNLLTYEAIQLGLTVEAGAGRNEANPQQACDCTRSRNKLMFKGMLTANKSLGTMNNGEVQG